MKSGSREERLSCGKGWTFTPTQDYEQFLVELKAIAESLSEDLASSELSGKTVALSFKYDTFETVSPFG